MLQYIFSGFIALEIVVKEKAVHKGLKYSVDVGISCQTTATAKSKYTFNSTTRTYIPAAIHELTALFSK